MVKQLLTENPQHDQAGMFSCAILIVLFCTVE